MQNGVKDLLKMVFKNLGFLSKSQEFSTYVTIQFVSNFASILFTYVSNDVWRDFRLPVSEFATIAWKSFDGKFTTKIDFPIEHFMLLYTDNDIGSLKSLRT